MGNNKWAPAIHHYREIKPTSGALLRMSSTVEPLITTAYPKFAFHDLAEAKQIMEVHRCPQLSNAHGSRALAPRLSRGIRTLLCVQSGWQANLQGSVPAEVVKRRPPSAKLKGGRKPRTLLDMKSNPAALDAAADSEQSEFDAALAPPPPSEFAVRMLWRRCGSTHQRAPCRSRQVPINGAALERVLSPPIDSTIPSRVAR